MDLDGEHNVESGECISTFLFVYFAFPLTVIEQNGQLLVDSREVADQFFIESSYESGTGKPYKCFFLTRKGCDMVAKK